MRGVWKCLKVPITTGKTYRWKNPPIQGCDRWNVYLSKGSSIYKKRTKHVIDTRCSFCERRVKFQIGRQDGRGRPRPVLFYPRPTSMTHQALLEEVRSRNRIGEIEEVVESLPQFEGFVKGSELK